MKILPKPVDHILIQSDHTAIAPGPLEHEIAQELAILAEIESRGGATVYRFSEATIRRGLDHGRSGDEIKAFLKKTSKTPMPQPLGIFDCRCCKEARQVARWQYLGVYPM